MLIPRHHHFIIIMILTMSCLRLNAFLLHSSCYSPIIPVARRSLSYFQLSPQNHPSSPSSLTTLVAVAAEGASATRPSTSIIYQGFWGRALKLMQARLPGLEKLEIPSDLSYQERLIEGKGKRAASKTIAQNHAYHVPGLIRQARAALVHTEEGLPPKVLNFVIFPETHLNLPIFGADLVSLPGGHLIVLDFQPVLPQDQAEGDRHYQELRRNVYYKYKELLPSGGEIPEAARPFFSDCHLFTRLEDDERVSTVVLEAFEAYLDAYLDLVCRAVDSPPSSSSKEEKEKSEILAAHQRYSTYRAINDPARGMLTRLFGEEWTEKLIYNLLFDLAEKPPSKH